VISRQQTTVVGRAGRSAVRRRGLDNRCMTKLCDADYCI
jgi:hypothetical protein